MKYLTPRNLVLLLLLALAVAIPNSPTAHAAPASSHVVVVSDFSDDACIGRGAIPHLAPAFSAFTFKFQDLHLPSHAVLAGNDTVLLNFCSPQLRCNSDNLSAADKTTLLSFVTGGGKMIIYDSECGGLGLPAVDYSWLPPGLQMRTSSPGPTSQSCPTAAVCDLFKSPGEPDTTLSAKNPSSPYYVDNVNRGVVGAIETFSDAVGDSNNLLAAGNQWCADLDSVNGLGHLGHTHAYSKPSELGGTAAGTGLIIYNGLDINEMSATSDPTAVDGPGYQAKLWFQELKQPWNPTDLPCGAPISPPTISGLKVSKFFTRGEAPNNLLPEDANGNPKVDVVLASGIVTSTNPGEIRAWVNVTNPTSNTLQSLQLTETLPVDWVVHPPWIPGRGGIHILFADNAGSSGNQEITHSVTVTVTTGNPEVVMLAIANFDSTIGHPLNPGQSLLLSVKLDYGLKGTSQSAQSYPRDYTDTANAAGWTQPSFAGTEIAGTANGLFVATAKAVGNTDSSLSAGILAIAALELVVGGE